MLQEIVYGTITIGILVVTLGVIALWRYIKTSPTYKKKEGGSSDNYELTILLGSGGHTG
jgi:hypothetical protein